MYSYALLEPGCHYLIQEFKDDPIHLIKINVESDHCVFITRHYSSETMEWKKKTDPIHDIIELLSDDVVTQWDNIKNAYSGLEEEDDELE
ncbi:MAG: hypothetical protein ACO29O_02570 [Chitinophagaceae bacterium]